MLFTENEPKTVLAAFRMTEAEAQRLRRICDETGMSRSQITREGLKLIDQEYRKLERGQND